MAEETKGKPRTYLPALLIVAGVFLLATAVVDLIQGDGINGLTLAAGAAVIAAGVLLRRKEVGGA